MVRSAQVNHVGTGRPPGGFFDGLCSFPNCDDKASDVLRLPLCDAHLAKVYRQVSETMIKTANKRTDLLVPNRTKPTGLVYFIQFDQRIKIGYTTDLHLRLRALPHDKVLATLAGTMQLEKRLHRKFAHLRVVGEWFTIGDDLLAYIDGINAV